MKLDELKVYNPKDDGIDYKTFKNAWSNVNSINHKLAHILHDGLTEKVLNSKIDENTSLKDFLMGDNSYFAQQNNAIALVFMDGQLYKTLIGEKNHPSSDALEQMATTENAVPFIFSYNPAKHDYFQMQEVIHNHKK